MYVCIQYFSKVESMREVIIIVIGDRNFQGDRSFAFGHNKLIILPLYIYTCSSSSVSRPLLYQQRGVPHTHLYNSLFPICERELN